MPPQGNNNARPRIYTITFARVYPEYVAKAERKGRTKEEVDEIIRWLTGYSQKELEQQIEKQVDLESFYVNAPKLNSSRKQITGVMWYSSGRDRRSYNARNSISG